MQQGLVEEAKGEAKANEEKKYAKVTDGETEMMFNANEVISK